LKIRKYFCFLPQAFWPFENTFTFYCEKNSKFTDPCTWVKSSNKNEEGSEQDSCQVPGPFQIARFFLGPFLNFTRAFDGQERVSLKSLYNF
jgi:hypothetical protein